MSQPPEGGEFTKEDQDPLLRALGDHRDDFRDAPWRSIAVMGDSLAEGIGEALEGYRPLAWSYRVSDMLCDEAGAFRHLNVGKMNARIKDVAQEQLEAVLAFAPDLTMLVAGGNDLWSSRYDVQALEDGLDGLVRPLRDSGSDVLLFTLLDITKSTRLGNDPDGTVGARLGELAAVTRRVAERRGCILVDLADDPAAAGDDLYASDALHSSARGHAYIAAHALKALGDVAVSRRQQAASVPASAASGAGR